MSGAMVEIEARLPQRRARQGVELRSRRAFRKARHGDGDMALQHAGEAIAKEVEPFAWRNPDRHGAGDVGRPIAILPAGIDEIELALFEPPVALLGHTVMVDCA